MEYTILELRMLEVQKGLPLPKVDRPAASQGRKYPLEDLGVGEMFFIPEKSRRRVGPHISNTGRKLGRKFTTRTMHMHDVDGTWAPCDADRKGAVAGVGVWRVE